MKNIYLKHPPYCNDVITIAPSRYAIFDDPSIGRKFNGRTGIKEYFNSYFVGYKTQTKKVKRILKEENQAHLEVEFTGDFPEGKIGGTFDFKFEAGKISYVLADLI